jgi:hypothetical protein
MIADRRKDQYKNTRNGARKPSVTDRSIATGRAKRDAAMKARRGFSEQTKPSAMEVDREIYRQSRKTVVAKKMAEKRASGGRLPPNSSLRDTKSKNKGTPAGKMSHPQPPTGAAASVVGGKTPSKKQVEAAIIAMTDIGQPVPAGHQLVLTFIPVATTPNPKPQLPQAHNKKGRGGGGGAAAGAGASVGPKTQNKSNFRRGRGNKN